MNGNHVNDDDVDDFFAYSADSASFLAHIDIHTESKRQCDGVADEAKNEKRGDEERKKHSRRKKKRKNARRGKEKNESANEKSEGARRGP